MRICHVVPTYLPATRYGGPIHSVHGLCKGLAGLGHRVEVYTTSVDGRRNSKVPHGEAVDLDGVGVHYFRSRLGRRLYYAPPLGHALASAIDDFDVVHLHSVFLWPTSRAARLARAATVPYVVSPRGMLVRELIEAQSRLVKTGWLELIESTTLAQAAGVHFTSEQELGDARALPLPLPRPFVVPNGVERPVPVPQTAADERHVLYLGRLSWKKNLEALIEAIAGTDLKLTLCGPDDEELAPRLRELAKTHGVGDRLAVRAPVTGPDKWEALARASLVVLPSLNENFGNVVPEAMAVGRPVVVSAGVGAREIVERASCGLVCEGTPAALREAMLALWRDPKRCERLGAAGADHVTAHLTWERVAGSMADRYRRVIAGADRHAR